MTDKLVVDLGGKGHYSNGTITVNIDPKLNSDIVCDITATAKKLENFFQPDSVHMFTCIHTLEHLDPREALNSMAYWRGMLEPGGRLLVIVPDVAQIMKDWHLEKITSDTAISILYNASVYKNTPPWAGHQWGWTKHTLRRDMTRCGYVTITPERKFSEKYKFDRIEYTYTGDTGYEIPNLAVLGVKGR